MQAEYFTSNADETKKLSKTILSKFKNYNIYLLYGDLGSGKTTFTQGLADNLGIKQKVQSPTFVIEKRYVLDKTNEKSIVNKLIHIDLYRINKDDQLIADLADEYNDKKSLIIVEWPDRLFNFLPKHYLRIDFFHLSNDKRKIIIREF